MIARTLSFVALVALAVPLRAQDTPRAIPVAALAGQRVAVLPLTLVARDPALTHDALHAERHDHRATLAWADSVIGEAMLARGPEVTWVLPRELRKFARRSPGMVADPDEMGQAMLRSSRLKDVPEPLRAKIRSLVAVAGGRMVLVPAALGFARDADGQRIRADLTLVLADARNGKIVWRSVASGAAATTGAALETSLAAALPFDAPTQ